MWKSGSPDRKTSSASRTPMLAITLYVLISRLKWLSTAPFGRPVVPDVYMMNAGSCSGTSITGATSEAFASTGS